MSSESPNTDSLSERLEFININQEVRNSLKAIQPKVSEILPGILDSFYEHLSQWPPMKEMFRDERHMQAAKSLQIKHWENITSGEFNESYRESVETIGKTHNRLGLEPRWYIAGYSMIMIGLTHGLLEKNSRLFGAKQKEALKENVNALIKAAMLDMDLAISTYLEAAEEDKKRTLKSLAETFDRNVGEVVDSIVSSSTQLTATAGSFGSIVETTTDQISKVASSSEEMSASMQTISSASQELSSSIHEIASQVENVSDLANGSAKTANIASQKIADLSEAAQKITEVVVLIKGIADQTNLLALNAAVEAARVGEAGKGFAVVANEVKSLAEKTKAATKAATEDVEETVSSLQTETSNAAESINAIAKAINDMNQATDSITVAVTQQSSATQEIASNVEQASLGTKEINESIIMLTDSSKETKSSSKEILQAANSLSDQGDTLKSQVDEFLETVQSS